ncbi:MAG: Gfo/Idh/MocA family oxidoreductase [Steroidobacteraceae bacterium]
MARIRYAIIGLGHIAQAAMLPAFAHARRNSALVALISNDREKLERLGRRYKVKNLCHYEAAEQLFHSGEIDSLYIALPNSRHAQWAIKAMQAGVHVLCEKPMATTAQECERMLRAARKARVRLMIAYRLHFERANLEAAQIVRSGTLGEPRYFNAQFSQQVPVGNIRLDGKLGGGPLWDIGIYCINAARSSFAAEPTRVWATANSRRDRRFREVPETVTAVLEFPGQRVASINCSFGAADRSRYEIVGTKGSLVVDPAFHYAEGLGYQLEIGKRRKVKTFARSDQFAAELVYFSDCVQKKREPEPSGEEGMIDVAIIEALHRSIRTGKWVSLARVANRKRRPSLRQEIRRPAVPREPKLVKAKAPHA